MLATQSPEIAPRLQARALGMLPAEPLVSVLVGNYNYANYLSQSIESVLNQTYANWELIICDDGSTDRSVQVISAYVERDRRIRLVRKENGGHPSSLNAAYTACTGDVICLLDSDDLYLPSKLQQVLETCAAHPEAGLIIHRVIRVDQQRNRQGVWPLADLPEGWYGPELLKTGGILSYLPPTSGLVLRREVAELLFPLRTEHPFRSSPDQIIMRLAPLVTNIAAIPNAMAEYRLHDANTYAQQRVTTDSFARELELSKALWQEQYSFLTAMSGEAVAQQLRPLETNPHCAFLCFLDAKLRGLPIARRYHAEYLARCKAAKKPRWFYFWRLSIYLPTTIFRFAINVLLGQNALKQAAARLRKLA